MKSKSVRDPVVDKVNSLMKNIDYVVIQRATHELRGMRKMRIKKYCGNYVVFTNPSVRAPTGALYEAVIFCLERNARD